MICEGIRGAVEWLNSAGFKTSDSGDGSHFRDGMEGAMEDPMVYIVSNPCSLVRDANRLRDMLDGVGGIEIQAMYGPLDGNAGILVTGDGLLHVRGVP